MLFVSPAATLPESQRSGWPSRASVDATRIWYAVWRAAGEPARPSATSSQLSFGVASPSPIGSRNVSARRTVAVSVVRSVPPEEVPAIAGDTDPRVAPTATTSRHRQPRTRIPLAIAHLSFFRSAGDNPVAA